MRAFATRTPQEDFSSYINILNFHYYIIADIQFYDSSVLCSKYNIMERERGGRA